MARHQDIKMIKRAVTFVRNDAFLKNNVVFFVGSILIAFFNYLYHPIMSRLMTVESFGEVQTIFSLVFLSGVILTVFYRMVLHITSNSDTDMPLESGAITADTSAIPGLYTAALLIHLPFVILLGIASPFISHFFAFQSSWSFAVFAVALLLTVPTTFYGAYFHGRNEFATLSVSQAITSAGKLIVAILLVLLGMGVFGAIGALAIASLMSILFMRAKSEGFKLSIVPFMHMLPALKREIPYGILIFMSLGLVTFLYSADVLVVKHLFSPEVAGLYSGVATIARIIFFVTASISGVLLSSIKLRNSLEENRLILKKGILYVAVIGGGVLAAFVLFPVQIISLLIGAKYVSMAHLLPLFSLSTFLVSLLSLFVTYFVALRSVVIIPVSILGFLSVFTLIALSHGSTGAIVLDFAVSSALTLVFLAISAPIFKKTL